MRLRLSRRFYLRVLWGWLAPSWSGTRAFARLKPAFKEPPPAGTYPLCQTIRVLSAKQYLPSLQQQPKKQRSSSLSVRN